MGLRRFFNRRRYGVTLDSHDAAGETMLSAAIKMSDAKAVENILHMGASPDHPNARGEQPLFLAIQSGDMDIFRHVVVTGATLHSSCDDLRADQYALAHNQPEMCAIIRRAYSDDRDFDLTVRAAAYSPFPGYMRPSPRHRLFIPPR